MGKHQRATGSDVPPRDATVRVPRGTDRRGEQNEQITNTTGWRGRHRKGN